MAATPIQILAYLKSIAGKSIISGQVINNGDTGPIGTIATMTGKTVGLLGGDYCDLGSGAQGVNYPFNAPAIAHSTAGGLVLLNYYPADPTKNGGSLADLLKPGTQTNNALNADLAFTAKGLLALQAAGVGAMGLRPYIELNGNWFWWGVQSLSAAQMQALWIYTFNYMVNTAKLTNLLWIYAINAGTTLNGRTLIDTYPGSAYVDIVGFDLYTSNPGSDGASTYQALLPLGKPVILAEFGSGSPQNGDTSFQMPTLLSQIKASMPQVCLWQQWWSGNSGGSGWGMEIMQGTSAALNNAMVVNRPVPVSSTIAVPPSPPSLTGTVIKAGGTAVIFDAKGISWGITSGGQVSVGGVTDSSTSNVTEMAYVSGVVWQMGGNGGWWSNPSGVIGQWQPANSVGTTSPLAAPALVPVAVPTPVTTSAPALVPVPPPAAAAVGFNVLTFGPAATLGGNWFPFSFQGAYVNQSGAAQAGANIAISGAATDGYDANICTAAVGSTAANWTGVAFGGGGYFECSMAFSGPTFGADQPGFWANDVEMMAAQSATGNPPPWGAGQAANYGHWVEVDMAEFDAAAALQYGFGIHDWFGVIGSGNGVSSTTAGSPGTVSPGTDFSTPHLYGFLWVPATAGSKGYAKWFFDRVQIGAALTWALFNPASAPPPVVGSSAFAVLDTRHLALLLGTASAANPMTVYSVAVWQASAAHNLVQAPLPAITKASVQAQLDAATVALAMIRANVGLL